VLIESTVEKNTPQTFGDTGTAANPVSSDHQNAPPPHCMIHVEFDVGIEASISTFTSALNARQCEHQLKFVYIDTENDLCQL